MEMKFRFSWFAMQGRNGNALPFSGGFGENAPHCEIIQLGLEIPGSMLRMHLEMPETASLSHDRQINQSVRHFAVRAPRSDGGGKQLRSFAVPGVPHAFDEACLRNRQHLVKLHH